MAPLLQKWQIIIPSHHRHRAGHDGDAITTVERSPRYHHAAIPSSRRTVPPKPRCQTTIPPSRQAIQQSHGDANIPSSRRPVPAKPQHQYPHPHSNPLNLPSEPHKAMTPSHYPRRTIPNPTIGWIGRHRPHLSPPTHHAHDTGSPGNCSDGIE